MMEDVAQENRMARIDDFEPGQHVTCDESVWSAAGSASAF
jgi:hypothetical protein